MFEPIELNITETPVLWINLDEATERKEKMESMFERHGFKNVTRIPGIKHERGLIGCGLAFLQAFEQARLCKFQTIRTLSILVFLRGQDTMIKAVHF